MRLKQIKLAGFKSFVDPTTVPYPANLSAIVGPNGCGKSNIIDAVRWVMGESSAKNLRGDAMTDVIFNGSTARKPVGQASVELVFDNTEGKLQGEYASYNELSIKRSVNRESQSNYYLNGTRCRRKDITDIFLGTGMGPRSYAIIEQGMISRLIESKPHELRVFIEEAAGISKYKERRRETENRIRHTRENLDRLSDLREELGKQLSHLQRQAQAAAKYKDFREQERQLKAQLAAIRWHNFDQSVSQIETKINQLTVELEAKAADQQKIDTDIEKQRDIQIDTNDRFNEVQGRYYGIGANISRIEQDIKHRSDRKIELNQDLERSKLSLKNIEEIQLADAEKAQKLQIEIEELSPEYQRVEEIANLSHSKLLETDELMSQWQQQWDQFNLQASENSKRTEIVKNSIQHLDANIEHQNQKKDRLIHEKETLLADSNMDDSEQLLKQLNDLADKIKIKKELNEEKKNILQQKRAERDQLQLKLDQEKEILQNLQGEKVSLTALQNAALGKSEGVVSQWLNQHDMDSLPRFAEKFKVESGWEKAIETVLGDYLQAVVVSDVDSTTAFFEDFQEGKVTLLEAKTSHDTIKNQQNWVTLAEKIDSDFVPDSILEGVFVAETIQQALTMKNKFQGKQSVITKDGIWVGSNWLRINREQDPQQGILEREHRLEQLLEEVNSQQQLVDNDHNLLTDIRAQLIEVEKDWQQAQSDLIALNQEHAVTENSLNSIQSASENINKRVQRINDDIDDIDEQKAINEEKLSNLRLELEEAVEQMAVDQEQRESLIEVKDERRENLIHVREKSREDKEQVHKLALRTESLTTELNSTKNNQQRSRNQLIELSERIELLKVQIEENITPMDDLKENLALELDKHLEVESELKQAREKLDVCDQQLRSLEKTRMEHEKNYDAVRQKLESEKLSCQGLSFQRENQQKILSELNRDRNEVLEHLPEQASETEWQESITRIQIKIERLGAINLAAIDEFETQSERKVYLDSQHEDLMEALETLESAIRKIDKETRTKFKETFDKINKGLQELFPKVFGGGHAYLELTGDDLLDTGVAILARPPGKRNSTIHLLSGGEKAMTAIALVFAIFHLNPAPFCMLDEVDAPLDDANVGRYCKLVEEMSQKIQFIFISHNKQAMEMADSLIGVTMQEPGVSRMVSVDIEEATAMAAQ